MGPIQLLDMAMFSIINYLDSQNKPIGLQLCNKTVTWENATEF